MIENLSIRNFKVLREVDLKLRPLTVIVGPNASGKSSILQAIWLLRESLRKGADRALQGPWDLETVYSANSKGPSFIHCQTKIGGVSGSVRLSLRGEKVAVSGDRVRWDVSLLNLEVGKLSAPSYPKKASLRLPSDGEGLSAILAGIHLGNLSLFERIVERLRSVIPNVVDIRLRIVPVSRQLAGYEIVFDTLNAKEIAAHGISSGTLLTLGILTAISSYDAPHIVLIDDIERGLHPKALQELIQQLRALLEQMPDLQIIATSHSPYLVDFLGANEVILTVLDEQGYTAARLLSEHPDYERWKDLMAPGEFWSSVGEDWITKEKKATAQ